MFNGDLKKEAVGNMQRSYDRYNWLAGKLEASSQELFAIRKKSSDELIVEVESFINGLANSPKEFDKTFGEYRAEVQAFRDVVHSIEVAQQQAALRTGASTAAGVAAGVGTAALAPSAAMAIATTFGTASTGAAISGLSGAAATNAALAWLGGGALTAGGGGMSAGGALLALANPIGLAIGAAALLGGGAYYAYKNNDIAQSAVAKRKEIEAQCSILNSANQQVVRLAGLTSEHASGAGDLLSMLKEHAPNNYADYDAQSKEVLASLINHIHTLSELLNQKVS